MKLSDRVALMWRRGDLHRAASDTRSQTEMAQALGMTLDQLRDGIKRARSSGHAIPSYGELRFSPAVDDRFDASEWDDEPTRPDGRPAPGESTPSTTRNLEPKTRHLSRDEVPDGSVVAVISDVHIPYQDDHALRLVVECCEFAGATHVILNGDIADCGPSSRHEAKRRREILLWGTTQESVAPGMWLYEWARTKPCILVRGNHEGWVENEIKESPTMHGATPERLMGLWDDGDGWEVLPDLSRVRLGSRVWEHGDGFFKSGSPGANPGARLKGKAPDQTTSIGHCHIKHASFWTTEDEFGISRTRAAFFNGHLSRPESHGEYAGTYIQWQQSFEITRVYWVDDRPRFTTDQPEIHRDRYGKPIFEYGGRIFR